MDSALWVVQIVLAASFLIAGTIKSIRSRESLAPMLPWVDSVSTPTLRLVGVTQLAAGVGLVVPPLVDVATFLTPLAAAGLAVTMVLAGTLHVRRREPQALIVNAIIFAMAVFVAWGRFGPYSF